MKINLNETIKDFEGNALGEAVTIGSISVNALLAEYVDETNLAPEDKMKRFMLAQRIATSKTIELTAEETVLLKYLVGKGCTTFVMGRIWSVLDPATAK